MNLMKIIGKKVEQGEKIVLITLVDCGVGAPGAAGQMMAVFQDGTTQGTIGGGNAEYMVIEMAKEALQKNEKTFEFSFDLSEKGMICGGNIRGFGSVIGNNNRLIIFGAGHVGQKVSPIAQSVGFSVAVIDDREFAENFNNVEYFSDTIETLEDKLIFNDNTYILICTRGHQLDYQALRFCLNKTYAYLGMIGSDKKVRSILSRVQKEGLSEEVLQTIYAPVGLDIADGTPEEIAIAIVAELLQVKNKGCLAHMKDSRMN